MSVPIDRIADCIVLHDWEGELDQAKWFSTACQFFFEVDSTPDLGEGEDGTGQVKSLKPKTIEKRLAEGAHFSGISLYATLPPHTDLGSQWKVFAGFNVTGKRKKVLAFIYEAGGTELDVGLFADLVFRVSSFAKLSYGYGYQRSFAKGPAMFAYDLAHGFDKRRPEDRAEYAQMSLWYKERLDLELENKPAGFRHLLGLQRDVFPFNVLSASHLSQPIEGVSLEKWIQANAARGHLHTITPTIWSWTIPVKQVPGIRDHLQMAGLLISRPPHSSGVQQS